MPTEVKNIEKFNLGIMSSPSGLDIPDEASQWSLDVDGDTSPGKLIGRYQDSSKTAVTGAAIKSAKASTFIDNAGQKDLIYYDATEGDLSYVTDFFGTPGTLTDLDASFGTGLTVGMQTFDKVARVGRGSTSALSSKWVGRIDHGQYGGSAPSGIQYENADCTKPDVFPNLYKVIAPAGASTIYGISLYGQHLYKITSLTGAIEDTLVCHSTQGLCVDPTDSTYCYLFDNDNDFGVLYRISLNDFSVSARYVINGWGITGIGLTGTNIISDIYVTNGTTPYIFFFEYPLNGTIDPTVAGVNVLWKQQVSTLSVSAYNIPTVAWKVKESTGTLWTMSSSGAPHTVSVSKAPFVENLWMIPDDPISGPIDDQVGVVLTNIGEMIYDTTPSGPSAGEAAQYGCVLMLKENETSELFYESNKVVLVSLKDSPYCYLCSVTSMQVAKEGDGNLLFIATRIDGYVCSWQIDTSQLAVYGIGRVDGDLLPNTYIEEYAQQAISYLDLVPGWDSLTYSNGPTMSLCGIALSPNHILMYIFDAVRVGRYLSYQVHQNTGIFDTPVYVKISNFSIKLTAMVTPVSTFDGTVRPFYKASFVYDNIQESPLMDVWVSPVSVPSNTYSLLIEVGLLNVSGGSNNVSSRVTGVNIYRAENDSGDYEVATFYRLVCSIDVTEGYEDRADLTGGFGIGYYYKYFYYDIRLVGTSFEDNAGIGEALTTTNVNYELSTQVLGYHFVTRAYVLELDDATRMLFRSKKNAPDTFDWSIDYLVLPFKPTAIVAYGVMLYVFDATRLIKINPEGMYIEDIHEGIGCANEQSVVATEFGLFFCDVNNFYKYDGQKIVLLGDLLRIASSPATGWQYFTANSYTTMIGILTKYNSILFFVTKNTVVPSAFVYHIPDGRVDFLSLDATVDSVATNGSPFGVIQGNTGECYLSAAAGTFQIQGSTGTRKACSWYSKIFDFGFTRQNKYLEAVSTDGANVTITTSVDGAAYTAFSAGYGKTIAVLLTLTPTGYLSTLEIRYRLLKGVRTY